MMKPLTIAKIGADHFDALHAYGLALLVAAATGEASTLTDIGACYIVRSAARCLIRTDMGLLADLLPLPTADEVRTFSWQHTTVTIALATLDGLLAATLTQKGARLVSLDDILAKHPLRPTAVDDGLAKATSVVERWTVQAQSLSRRPEDWVREVLDDYGEQPTCPIVVPTYKGHGINVGLPLDPTLSYSARRPTSDGWITRKSGVTIREPRYAVTLANIAAARFLRAQCVRDGLVVLYLPLATKFTVESTMALPPLRGSDRPPAHAALSYAFRCAGDTERPAREWDGLVYHTVRKTQRTQQFISMDVAFVDLLWLRAVKKTTSVRLVTLWQTCFAGDDENELRNVDALLDAILGRRIKAWFAHLLAVARHHHQSRYKSLPVYSIIDVQGVTDAMTDMIGSVKCNGTLSDILHRPTGTRRFGHALRQLGRHRPSVLRDIVPELDAVRTCDSLIRVLAIAVQQCAAAHATNPFIIVPSDADLADLLDDVDRFSAPTVAGLLIILSALHFPGTAQRGSGSSSISDGISLNSETGEGGEVVHGNQ